MWPTLQDNLKSKNVSQPSSYTLKEICHAKERVICELENKSAKQEKDKISDLPLYMNSWIIQTQAFVCVKTNCVMLRVQPNIKDFSTTLVLNWKTRKFSLDQKKEKILDRQFSDQPVDALNSQIKILIKLIFKDSCWVSTEINQKYWEMKLDI